MSQDWGKWFPIQCYLERLHERLAGVTEGRVADYIPELATADPAAFGIALVTVDGNVYQVGDARRAFTIQSISKPITYGLALADHGVAEVDRKVGVEPSGEAFNSISLEPDSGRPRNPMINAGAIATTGLVKGDTPAHRFSRIMACFERYTGHPVRLNEAVYRSERDTGFRNRAISHLLRSTDILEGAPEDVLDVYFRQCSIEVTARDLALMGACLANSGVNPITGLIATDRRYVEKVLSVMGTCGMYDFSGSWIYRVGMPAKSGVGGGIMAALPGQFGLGVYSAPLDEKGNSVRGIRVCEELSRDFGLHMFKVARATSSSVLRTTYDAATVSSRRIHHETERDLLREHGQVIRVYELQGELMFGSTDSVLRTMAEHLEQVHCLILDFSRVVDMDASSMRLLADLALTLQRSGRCVLFTGTEDKFAFRQYLHHERSAIDAGALLAFTDRDRALESCEDKLLQQHMPAFGDEPEVPLDKQYLCDGLSTEEMNRLVQASVRRDLAAGESVFRAGDPGQSFFMIVRGRIEILVRITGRQDRRLSTIGAGTSFGEIAMVNDEPRSAEARAVVDTVCYELAFSDLDERMRVKLLVKVAKELSRRLSQEARKYGVLGGRN